MIPAIEFENVSFEYGTPARAAKKRGLFCGRRLAAKRVLSTADAAGDSVGGAGKGCQGGAQARCREQATSGATSSDRPCAAEGGARQGAGVRDVSFALLPGEFVAVIGNNGAGKTTLSKLMNGLIKPTSGRVLIDGVPTTELRTSALAARVGMLFQNPDRQICQPTVCDEIALGLRLQGVADAQGHAARVADDFELPADASPFALSRGERQRLALASVVACEPSVLVLDEPTTGLDYRECMRIMTRVRELNQAGTTVVMVCHDMELVADFAQRVLVMANGRLIADGAPEEVFRDREILGEASVMPPQMIDLALRLEATAHGKAFAQVSDVRGMVEAVAACVSEAKACSEVVAAAEAIVRGDAPGCEKAGRELSAQRGAKA
ncbi:ABC transporter ATP-binding protein [Slackia piriformis]|nr:ABC transporter ATP-binding protein [Slackia piriformis]